MISHKKLSNQNQKSHHSSPLVPFQRKITHYLFRHPLKKFLKNPSLERKNFLTSSRRINNNPDLEKLSSFLPQICFLKLVLSVKITPIIICQQKIRTKSKPQSNNNKKNEKIFPQTLKLFITLQYTVSASFVSILFALIYKSFYYTDI